MRVGVMRALAAAATAATLLSGLAKAQANGALPKGNAAKLDQGKATGPKAKAVKDTSCYEHLVRPPGGNALFAGGDFFLLAQTSDIGKASDQSKPTVRHTLYRLPLAGAGTAKPGAAEALLSLEHRVATSLAAVGAPVSAVSAVAFLGPTSNCFEGPAAIVSATFSKAAGQAGKGEQAVRATGQFYFVETPAARLLVDMKKKNLLTQDPESFQTKTLRKIDEHERGLFYDPDRRTFTAWYDDGKQRGLVQHEGADEKKPRRLAVVAGDRVVQERGNFAVLRTVGPQAPQTLELQELAAWTGVKEQGFYKFSLPKGFAVARAGVDVSFAKRIAVVSAVGFAAQRQWQRVFVIDYAKDVMLGVLKVSGNAFLSFAGIDPSGQFVLAEVRDQKSRKTIGLKLFDVATKKVRDVQLPTPSP